MLHVNVRHGYRNGARLVQRGAKLRNVDNEQIAFALFNLCYLIAKLDDEVVFLLHKLLAANPDLVIGSVSQASVGIEARDDRALNIRFDSVA